MPQLFIDRATGEQLTEALFRRVTRERASLGSPIPADACDALGYDLLEQAEPPAHDTSTKKVVLGPLVSTGPATFAQGWEIVDLSAAELDAKAAEFAAMLARARTAKAAELTEARVAADRSHFEVGGKLIAVDDASMRQITAITGYVALFGTFPPDFPNVWKAMDNTYHPLPDTDAWKVFISAMAAQGVVNFAKQQTLKAQLAPATTLAQIEAISW